ncbi:uncharacterized protein CANTADRAFT_20243 [Suhomyces tanzawaensis NRRL Y-17324]|uniref:Uncharacterized protein n=1 Tax=Suhomyces tanzawaensis NRRL Y-17324 TaxID=984487 RepID=A0A1E4SMD3_9ASCO|nr:uncharacterized protein CANTADRAFT_20243 [Suhomyces tanzawaensis NRRL Y-17324]ODV80671.1 hypothetical protein CANTADRAFT_20243 [Suhomyces tanzawaensis NRRL Y-17324]
MNLLSLLGPGNQAVKKPSFEQGKNHDSIDLQIKSLLYLFKRLRINKLSTFLDESHNLKYIDQGSSASPELVQFYEKLDQTYGATEFVHILTHDEYRVMVDFVKNKFRSYCVVSEVPSKNLSRPSSPVKGVSMNEDEVYPPFTDYKDRKVKGFKFVYFPREQATAGQVATLLAESDIYLEHHKAFNFTTRYQYALESVDKVIPNNGNLKKAMEITEDEKASIIREYLEKMAFNVQLSRIYEGYMKLVEPQIPSRSSSPTRIKVGDSPKLKAKPSIKQLNLSELSLSSKPTLPQASPTKTFLAPSPLKLSPMKSSQGLRTSRPSSPTKQLKAKPSISKMRLDELYNPVASPPVLQEPFSDYKSESSHTSETSSTHNDNLGHTEIRVDIYEKCKLAVADKLKREKLKLAS